MKDKCEKEIFIHTVSIICLSQQKLIFQYFINGHEECIRQADGLKHIINAHWSKGNLLKRMVIQAYRHPLILVSHQIQSPNYCYDLI